MSDKIEITGLEIKIDGKPALLSIEDAWELKRELDKLLHAESIPCPYPYYVPAPGDTFYTSPDEGQWSWASNGRLCYLKRKQTNV